MSRRDSEGLSDSRRIVVLIFERNHCTVTLKLCIQHGTQFGDLFRHTLGQIVPFAEVIPEIEQRIPVCSVGSVIVIPIELPGAFANRAVGTFVGIDPSKMRAVPVKPVVTGFFLAQPLI